MNTPAASPSAFSLRRFALTVLVGGLVLGTSAFGCVPASWRLTTPITCPAGTRDSAVVSHVTRSTSGSIVTQYEFRCIDADGGSTAPWGLAVFGVMTFYGTALAFVLALANSMRRRASVPVAVAVAAMALGGCGFGTLTRDEFEARYPYGAGPMFSRGGAESAARGLEDALGGPQRVTGVSIAPDSVSFAVLGRDGDADVYTYRDGELGEPTPVQSSADDTHADEAFALRPADLGRVPALVREAPRRIGIAGSHVTSVVLDRDGDRLQLRLDVESAHRRGSARYDLAGTLLESRID